MRVLLMESDTAAVQRIELILREDAICIDTTDAGEDGIGLCRRYDYDVIVMELRLSDMSGFDVIRALRKARVMTPILVLTGNAVAESQIKALNLGADCFMPKPFHKDELVARIRALVRRSRGHANSAITTGMITLNLAAKTVEANGRTIRLSDKEYQILELLSLRRGATLNKEMFIDHLYDGDGPESRTIELFICKLRKKLSRATGGDRCIQTIGRFGYSLRPTLAA